MSSKIFVKNNLKLESKNSQYDIGIDMIAQSVQIVGKKINDCYSEISYIEYDTNIFLDPLKRNAEEQIYTLIYARSSISKKNLSLCNSVGLIDPNYRESIKLRFKYIYQPEDLVSHFDHFLTKINQEKIYKVGDKIGQLVFAKTIPFTIEYVPELMMSDRSGGFGSTGE